MDSLTWEGDLPQLRSPILVCSFRGWNDAAAAASTALATVAESLDAELIAQVDPEEYFDFQATRPTITLTEGQARRIDWPENNLVAARVPAADRDLVLLDGTEPNLRWRTFSETIATAADALGVEMVITMGALIAEVSHTLPVPITGLASDEELVEELDLQRSSYEGPTGIAVEASELEEETSDYEEQIGRAIAANPEIEELVQRIEAEQVEQLGGEVEDLPSADTIAREFQRFLRQQGP